MRNMISKSPLAPQVIQIPFIFLLIATTSATKKATTTRRSEGNSIDPAVHHKAERFVVSLSENIDTNRTSSLCGQERSASLAENRRPRFGRAAGNQNTS